ncbi:MAG: polysaccharide biosynthesis C-terminal domain-containing protein, partial [Nanoarchaeota archaeon]|nr:polysaccharide biosynthesis C-terminal domain-containing protein [Nanoarchaeota archaeon]
LTSIYRNKKTIFIPIIYGIILAINITLNLNLIPSYNIIGASIAKFISFFIMMVIALFVYTRSKLSQRTPVL